MSSCNIDENKKYSNVLAFLNLKHFSALLLLALSSFSAFAQSGINPSSKTIIWQIDNLNRIDGYKPIVIGNPIPVKDQFKKSLSFNGINDGLVIPKIPIEGWGKFTIEVLFKPDGDGPTAPRFVHFEDKEGNRGTIEARITQARHWYLDTFLKNGTTGKGLTLIDSTLLHPTDQWYWVSLTYDGEKMTSYVNGIKELEGTPDFPVLNSGKTSLGVRLNQVNWFKGLIHEVRFHPEALTASSLKKTQK